MQLSGIKYIYNVVQLTPLSTSRTLSLKLCTHRTETPQTTTTRPQPLPTTIPTFCLYELTGLETSLKWTHKIFVLWCPAYLNQLTVSKVLPCISRCQHFLSNPSPFSTVCTSHIRLYPFILTFGFIS